jgi:Terpene cyclase DEP1
MNRTLLIVVAIAFAMLSFPAVVEHGIAGIFLHQFQNLAGLQVLADLTIALGLFIVWMWGDARRCGRTPWPWLGLTLAAGSFGPLLYLLFAKRRPLDASPRDIPIDKTAATQEALRSTPSTPPHQAAGSAR